jgi:hypothetical protein
VNNDTTTSPYVDISVFLFGDRGVAAPRRRPPLKTGHHGRARRSSLRFHLHARSFPEYPWSSPNTESYISLPPHRTPSSIAATPVRMSHRPSPRLPGASPRARPCHAGPPSPTDVVTAALITSCPSGQAGAVWPWAGPGLCGSFPFSFSFIELEISRK